MRSSHEFDEAEKHEMERKPQLETVVLRRLLNDVHGQEPQSLEPIAGGFWSSAYVYRIGAERFVLRVGYSDEGYRIDQQAAALAIDGLPIPAVIEIGTIDGLHFAVSAHLGGKFVETRPVEEANAVGMSLAQLLTTMRRVRPDPIVDWYAPTTSVPSWAAWLRRSLDPTGSEWREALARHEDADAVFQACLERIDETLPQCPERRDWVHGDLLHQNVLVGEGGQGVTGVFSWKCSARGDFLYDVAWCTFWAAWHPVIEAADMWQRMTPATETPRVDLADAPIRHHCYELQIAASHFGWYVRTDDAENLKAAVERASMILERGPLAMPSTDSGVSATDSAV